MRNPTFLPRLSSQSAFTNTPAPRPSSTVLVPRLRPLELPPHVPPAPMPERLQKARQRIRAAALACERIVSYEIALDLDMSEFHFARQFRAAFGRSPHEYYNEVRAERAREMLRDGALEADVARRVGFRRPAELRALLAKFPEADAAE